MAWEKKPIDRMEMLSLLGLLYAHTAMGYGKVGLRSLMEAYGKPSVRPKRNFIIKALVQTKVLLYEGKQGKARVYKWNLKDYGAPSITIAEMLISESVRLAREKRNDYYKRVTRMKYCMDCEHYCTGGSCRRSGKAVGALRPMCGEGERPEVRVFDVKKEKLCKRCDRILPIERFALNRRNADGRQTYCRECASKAYQKWAENISR